MPIVALMIIGAAAGFLATRFMRVQTDVPTTIVIGVGGALIGGFLLRFLIALTGWMAGFIGALARATAHLPPGWHLRVKEHPSARTPLDLGPLTATGRGFRELPPSTTAFVRATDAPRPSERTPNDE